MGKIGIGTNKYTQRTTEWGWVLQPTEANQDAREKALAEGNVADGDSYELTRASLLIQAAQFVDREYPHLGQMAQHVEGLGRRIESE